MKSKRENNNAKNAKSEWKMEMRFLMTLIITPAHAYTWQEP
jgi:hypothetical protein